MSIIIIKSELFTPGGITMVEEKYHALFVCDTCLKGREGGWINQAVAVFWNRDPANIPEGGSAYFGLFFRHDPHSPPDFEPGPLMITNAISAAENEITGIEAENGDIIFSRFRHDYRGSADGSVWIDGGRDYIRYGYYRALSGRGGLVKLRMHEGELVLVAEQDPEVRSPIPTPALQRSSG